MEIKKLIRRFLNSSTQIERNSYIWNLIATLSDAAHSPFLMLVITWAIGLEEAGIFAIGYSFATQILIVGKYNIRNFQVTDQKQEYTFSDYFYSRVITSFAMFVLLLGYILIGVTCKNYTVNKSIVIFLIVITKIIDSVEDVIHGMYQQNGRLDIAAKCLGVRRILYLLLCVCLLIVLRNLSIALVIGFVFTLAICIEFIKITSYNFTFQIDGFKIRKILELLKKCFPLFVGAFCSVYTINAPKYAIDGTLSDSLQAIYGFISLPAMLIYIFTSAIFQSQVVHMSVKWTQKDYIGFNRIIMQQTLLLLGISAFAFLFCYWLGIPILSFVYRTNLTEYHAEFMFLFLGGIFLGISALLSTVLTVIRKQNYVLFGYGSVAVLAAVLFPMAVDSFGLRGSSVLYLGLMIFEMILFIILVVHGERVLKK